MTADHPIYGNTCAPSCGNFDLLVKILLYYTRGDMSPLICSDQSHRPLVKMPSDPECDLIWTEAMGTLTTFTAAD